MSVWFAQFQKKSTEFSAYQKEAEPFARELDLKADRKQVTGVECHTMTPVYSPSRHHRGYGARSGAGHG